MCHISEFEKILDSNYIAPFLGKAIRCYTLTRSFWLKFQTKKSNSLKRPEITTQTPM